MQKKIRKKIFLLLTLLLLSPVTFVFALEVPNGPCANSSDLPSCVNSLFQWGISIGATLAFVSFAIGAVSFIMAGADPSLATEGKDRMRNALLGVVILGAAFAILKTIDTKLINSTLNKLGEKEVKNSAVPGVYFYEDTDCKGLPFSPEASLDTIGNNFKAFKIVNSNENNGGDIQNRPIKYGVILHKSPGLENGGECGQPITEATDCQPLGNLNGAADIFQLNSDPESSGNGIYFYSRSWTSGQEQRGGYKQYTHTELTNTDSPTTASASSMDFSWEGTNIDPNGSEAQRCANFNACPGGIDILGDYIIALYSDNSSSGGSGATGGGGQWCTTFAYTVSNLGAKFFLAPGQSGGSASDGQNGGQSGGQGQGSEGGIQNVIIIPTVNSSRPDPNENQGINNSGNDEDF